MDGVRWDFRELEDVAQMPVFALETGGEDILSFKFPKRGICIVGSEEEGVSRRALETAERSLGRVSIRQYGVKGSINVASAVAVLLQYWSSNEVSNG